MKEFLRNRRGLYPGDMEKRREYSGISNGSIANGILKVC